MRRIVLAVAALGALGCGRKESPAVEAPAPAAVSQQKDASAVVLDAAVQKSAGIVVQEAAMRALPQVVRATARLSNDENRTWRVGAITEGRIVRVLANAGDRVVPGAILARMHSHDIHDSRATYRKSEMELARARSEETFALRTRDRAKRLYELKAGSLEQWERGENELKNAQTAVANAEVEVERNRHHLTEFLGIPAIAPSEGDETDLIPVTSPAAGTVLTRGVTPGTVVTPANDLFVISDLSSLWAIAEVNEEHLSRLRVGIPVRIYVQSYGKEPFAGRIGKLGEAFDPATRTVKVRVDLPNRGGRLKPEMYATAEIETGGSEPAIFVPHGATQELRGETVVFVQTAADRFQARPVELGRTLDGSFVEVVRGLKSGERIATAGVFVLKSEVLKATLAGE